MKRLIRIIALLAMTGLTAIAFIPLPQIVRVMSGRTIPMARSLYPLVQQGDTLIAYLADAAGNVATAWAVVDSTTQDSFYVHLVPKRTERNHGRP